MSSQLLSFDNELASKVDFIIGSKTKTTILFQFPPKITSDSRGGKWDEVELPGIQPIQIWATSGARKMTLEWTYVVGVNNWGAQKVRTQVINLHKYYTQESGDVNEFVVMLKLWLLGDPDNPMSFRLGNIDVTYGKVLYFPGENYGKAHPVITNVKVGMQPWAQAAGGSSSAPSAWAQAKIDAAGAKGDPAAEKLDVKKLIKMSDKWE